MQHIDTYPEYGDTEQMGQSGFGDEEPDLYADDYSDGLEYGDPYNDDITIKGYDEDPADAWLRQREQATQTNKAEADLHSPEYWQGKRERRARLKMGATTVGVSRLVDTSVDTEPRALIEGFNDKGYAKPAYLFPEIARQNERNEILLHAASSEWSRGKTPEDGTEIQELEEHEAIRDFSEFMTNFSELEGDERDTVAGALVDDFIDIEQASDDLAEMQLQARDMLDNFTYIGERERTEAVAGIAEHWKGWLNDNPEGQLCVLTEVTDGDTHVKSDAYIADLILAEFSDEEVSEYGYRLVADIEDMVVSPSEAKVVIVDDWILSGEQMAGALSKKMQSEAFQKYLSATEIQLLTATDTRLEAGLAVNSEAEGRSERDVIAVKAYYLAQEAGVPTEQDINGHKAVISGAHSTTDYNFALDFVQPAVDLLNASGLYEEEVHMPPLTNGVRTYRDAPLDSLKRLKRH